MNWLIVAEWWIRVRPIRALKEKRMLKKSIKWTAFVALAIGSVSQTLGIDLAPEQIDVLVNAGAVIAYIVTKFLEARAAKAE